MKTLERALNALDRLYSSGYNQLRNQNLQNDTTIEGFFMSDCGILFVRKMNHNLVSGFSSLLDTIKQINCEMIREDFMLMTSIAYGQFKYQNRIEFPGIEKNPIYGNAYISAYLDTERDKSQNSTWSMSLCKRTYAGLILDRTQRLISHLYGLLYRINFFYSKKIFPVYCFDGKISALKRVITKNQLKDFLFTQKWYYEAIK